MTVGSTPSLDIAGYPFQGPFAETKDLENRPGLFAVHSQRGDQLTLLDVGEAASVRERVRSHERQACWVERANGGLIAFSAYYTDNLPAELRAEIVALTREKTQPPCGEGFGQR